MKSVAAIIVSWNTKDLLRTCLQGLEMQNDIQMTVFVVDNNSADGSQAMVRNEFPKVYLITNTSNRGFSAANNQALQIARCDFYMLVNPDIEFTDIRTCKKIVDAHTLHKAGIIGPQLLNVDLTHQPSVRSDPDWLSQFLILTKLHILFPRSRSLKKYFLRNFEKNKTQKVTQISGAFFSISESCKETTGLLDEAFWIWFEEVDYCKRARESGNSIYYITETSVIHHGGQSFQKIIPRERQKKYSRSLLLYASKYFNPAQRFILHIGVFIGMFFSFITPRSLRLRTYAKK